jgi:glucose/arabinose dehydrogenase
VGPGGGPGPAPSSGKKIDPNVVATHLEAPVGLALLPDGSALVGERTTGRIVQVQPQPGRPVPTVRTLHGLDAAGDGGLLDLALSPTFNEDGLIYAYVTTRTDNRVVDFTLHGPVTPVFTGIPKGRTGNTGRILFGWDGDLYIGTGDAGRPRLAAEPNSLAGKVLRVDPIGDPASGNPDHGSAVWTIGHRVVDGLCAAPPTKWIFEAEAGTARNPDEINLLSRASYYGWPVPRAGATAPVTRPPTGEGSPGGCAVLGDRLWVTSLDGEALLYAPLHAGLLAPGIGSFTAVLKHRYGRLRTVVPAPDGALWLTTSNRDGHGNPVPDDERVIRYVPALDAAHSTL